MSANSGDGDPDRPDYKVYRSGEGGGSRRGADRSSDEPEYKVYRSRRFFGRLGGMPDLSSFRERLRRRAGEARQKAGDVRPERKRKRGRRPWLRWALIAVGGWIALSVVLFGVSAQIQKSKLAGSASEQLGGSPLMIAEGQTILVLGTDARPEGSQEPGAETRSRCLDQGASGEAPSNGCPGFRADTIMLVRAGGGSFEKLSIPRDTLADIPDLGPTRINSAYSAGGASLQIRTVEQFLGIDVDHVVILDFTGFADFIDAIGGVKIELNKKVKAKISGGTLQGGASINLRPGEHTLNGQEALAFARTRQNLADPSESDLDRAARQQQIVSGIKDRMTSPWRVPINFIRGPLIAWSAPKAMIGDMGALILPQLAISVAIGGDSKTQILGARGVSPGPNGSLVIPQSECERVVRRFLGEPGPQPPACSPLT